MPNNIEVFYEFAEKLVSDVDRCFDPPKKVRKRDSMLQGSQKSALLGRCF